MRRNQRSRQGNDGLRIAVVCFPVNPGFVDYLVGLVAGLRPHADVAVLTSDTMEATDKAQLGEAEFCFRRSRHLAIDIWKFVYRVFVIRPDVLLMQAWLKVPLLETPMIWLFRMFGVRCVVTVHDVLPHEPRRWHKPILRLYYGAFDALVAHSALAREQLLALGVKRPVAVIPCGLLDRFDVDHLSQAQARVRLPGVADDSFVALFFGHVSRRKGALAFAQAAAHLPPEANVRLILAGKPDFPASDLEALRAECSQRNVMFYEGHVPFEDVQTFFIGSDCVVIPYLEGTTSAVLKIAIAFEKPIVATRIGDVPETVDDRSAVLIGLDDLPAAIAAGIIEAQRRSTALEVGVRALKSSLSWDVIGKQYYDELSAAAKTRSRLRDNATLANSTSQM